MFYIYIGKNALTGPLPTELGKLTNATAIIFGECNCHYSAYEIC